MTCSRGRRLLNWLLVEGSENTALLRSQRKEHYPLAWAECAFSRSRGARCCFLVWLPPVYTFDSQWQLRAASNKSPECVYSTEVLRLTLLLFGLRSPMTFPSLTQKQMLWPGASGSGAVPWVGHSSPSPCLCCLSNRCHLHTWSSEINLFFFFFNTAEANQAYSKLY